MNVKCINKIECGFGFFLKEKLEKSAEKLKAQKDFYHNFIQEMDSWLVRNAEQVIKMFEEFDEDGESIITYDDFKSGNY